MHKQSKNWSGVQYPLNAKSNPKKFWSYVASQRKCSNNTCFTIDDTIVNNPINIANAFTENFASKFVGTYIPLDLSSLPDTPTAHGAPHLCLI